MSEIAIIEATMPDDVAAAKALFLAYARSLDFDLCFQDFDAEIVGFPGKYAPPGGALLLAHKGDAPVGAVGLRDLGAGVCEMKRLYVPPQGRGGGAGRRLVSALIETARARGYRAMRLDTIPGHHDAAIRLYRSFGFSEIAPYYDSPIPKTLYMELTL